MLADADFDNPSEEMIQDALKNGIDLKDPTGVPVLVVD